MAKKGINFREFLKNKNLKVEDLPEDIREEIQEYDSIKNDKRPYYRIYKYSEKEGKKIPTGEYTNSAKKKLEKQNKYINNLIADYLVEKEEEERKRKEEEERKRKEEEERKRQEQEAQKNKEEGNQNSENGKESGNEGKDKNGKEGNQENGNNNTGDKKDESKKDKKGFKVFPKF